MRELRITDVDHRTGIVTCSDISSGEDFALPLDDTFVHVASSRSGAPAPQKAKTGPLNPSEIQALIRKGTTPEDIISETSTDPDNVYRFASFVMREIDHVVARTQALAVPRGDTDSGVEVAATVGLAVQQALDSLSLPASAAQWSAKNMSGSDWEVTCSWTIPKKFAEKLDSTPRGLLQVQATWLIRQPLRHPVLVSSNDTALRIMEGKPAYIPPEPEKVEQADVLLGGLHTQRDASDSSAASVRVDAITHLQPAETKKSAASSEKTPASAQRPSMPSWEDVLLSVRSTEDEDTKA